MALTSLLRPRHRILAWLVVGVLIAVGIVITSELSHQRLRDANEIITRSMERQSVLSELLGALLDAESAERGYLLTNDEKYLSPYQQAAGNIDTSLKRLRELHGRDSDGEPHHELTRLVGEKLGELNATIQLFQKGGATQAIDLVRTDLGKHTMDRIREIALTMESEERARLVSGTRRWQRDLFASRVALGAMTALTILFMLLVARQSMRELALEQDNARLLTESNERLEKTVKARTAALSSLSSHLQTLQETEKARLARELHDELGSVLTATKMDVAWVMSKLEKDRPDLAEKLRRTGQTLDEGVQLKRRIIEDLRPSTLEHLGLTAAVRQYAEEHCKRAGLACEIDVPDGVASELEESARIALYRVVQESLTNILKYASAQKIRIAVRESVDGLKLIVQDDGVGFELDRALTQPGSHGIAGMRQRIVGLGGSFDITTAPGRGTIVEATLPPVLRPATG
jgi:signal transduction histidine kinase